MEMTEELFDSIINTAQDCVFWKDKNRRFVGVNQAFLDFYGFESADVLIGKTDEDMGWHSDPGPYKEDELRVLSGHSTYKVQGKCYIRGEERDIIASKKPIYEGDEIVGLVGSFVDITDVLLREKSHGFSQVLYKADQLRKYPYFDQLLDEFAPEELLDPLTGIISRKYFAGFARSLVEKKTPFTLCVLDLDNFKYINDNFGHTTGDLALKNVSEALYRHVGDHCIIGRFGGDELMIINLNALTYDDKKAFMCLLYDSGEILRRDLTLDEAKVRITGTSGCASFPEDAADYETLFSLADKTLYQGKSMGRNCYTIYLEEIHKDLDIKHLAKQGLYTNMSSLTLLISQEKGFENRIHSVMSLLRNELHIADLYYVGKKGVLHSVMDPRDTAPASDLAATLGKEELFISQEPEDFKEKSPVFYETLIKKGALSTLTVQVGLEPDAYGYLVSADSGSTRIWQQDECGIMYFVAKALAAHLRLGGEEIPD